MTQLISHRSGPKPAFLLLALLALVAAGLFGASQLRGAQAQTGGSSVTIVKEGLEGDDVATFTHNFPGDPDGTFQLGGAHGTSITFEDVPPGDYEVAEMPLDGYALETAGCAQATSRSAPPSLQATANNTLGIGVGEGTEQVCTFTNGPGETVQHTVTITKYIDDALATEGVFNLTATWTAANLDGGVQTSGDFTLEAPDWTAVTSPMDAGADYSVVENGIDATCESEDAYSLAGYGIGETPEDAAAADPVADASLTDLQADMYIVVFNESCDDLGSITIVKEGLEGDAAATFTHNVPDQGSDTFVLTALDNSETFEDLTPGSYTFTEEALDGWQLVSWSCDLQEPVPPMDSLVPVPEGQLTVVLGEGEDQVCTFVNEREPVDVTVLKYVDGALATEGAFDITYTAAAEPPVSAQLMEPDWASMAEVAFGESFSLSETGIDGTCDEGDIYRLAGYSMGATEADAALAELSDTAEIAAAEADATVIVWNQLCANLGSITIMKNFEPDAEGVSQNFTTKGMGLEDFSIPEGTDQLFDNLSPGDYTFTEGPLPGWELDGVQCTTETGPANAVVNLGGGSATVTLATGDNVVCTFTNEVDQDAGVGSITIEKVWQDATGEPIPGADTDFDTSANLGAPNNTFTLSDGAASMDFGSLSPDTYTFTEAELEGWELFSIFCGPGILDVDIDLEAGTLGVNLAEDQVITCTFTNREAEVPVGEGSLTIVKAWVDGDPVDTTFTPTEPLGEGISFTLNSDTTEMAFDELVDGDYLVTETALEGWTLTALDCEGETTSTFTPDLSTGELAVTLADGEALVCTFTNTADAAGTGSIVLTKVWDSENTGPDAVFELSDNVPDGDGTDDGMVTLIDDGANDDAIYSALDAGKYTFTEQDMEGWDISSIVCTGVTEDLYTQNPLTGELSVTLADGDAASCTFTNVEEADEPGTGSIVLTKLWDGEDAGPNATFALSDNLPDTDGTEDASVTLIDDGGNDDATFSALGGGTYTFDEADIPDWDVTAITCDGVATPAVSSLEDGMLSVTLAEGENALCTFTNTPDEDAEPEPGSGSILLTKLWEGDIAGPDAVFTLSANLGDADNSLTLVDDGANDDAQFDDLGVGTFTFAEADIADWDVTSITCTGIPAESLTADPVAGILSVTLADGQTASCTFTNAVTPAEPITNVTDLLPSTLSPTVNNVPSVSTVPSANNVPTGTTAPNANALDNSAPPSVDSNAPSSNNPAPASNVPAPANNNTDTDTDNSSQSPIANEPSGSSVNDTVPQSNTTAPQSNVAGAQQAAPLPPSAGNTSRGNSDTAALGLCLVLAMLAGATGAVVYGLRRR